MPTIRSFLGLNNVLPAERQTIDAKHGTTWLAEARNCDIGLSGEISRRGGYSSLSATKHFNVWQASGFKLATVGAGGDLTNVDSGAVLHAGLGHARVWYLNLPDGRTAYSNGTSCGIVTAAARTPWGPPIPASAGTFTEVSGSLHPGNYRHAITYVRTADGFEGPPLYAGAPSAVAGGDDGGGFSLASLPTLSGYRINVYLTTHNGGQLFLAGSTTTSMFSFTGRNDQLVKLCPTEFLDVAPAGRLLAFWRGRAYVAVGSVLYASKPDRWELFDLRNQDFKRFPDTITLVQPVEGGIFIGTTTELGFMRGAEFDKLTWSPLLKGAVVLGSGVTVPGKHLQRGQGLAGQGDCMLCIAGGAITAGYPDGSVAAMTRESYKTDAVEVAATFRLTDAGFPQYLAAVQ